MSNGVSFTLEQGVQNSGGQSEKWRGHCPPPLGSAAMPVIGRFFASSGHLSPDVKEKDENNL